MGCGSLSKKEKHQLNQGGTQRTTKRKATTYKRKESDKTRQERRFNNHSKNLTKLNIISCEEIDKLFNGFAY